VRKQSILKFVLTHIALGVGISRTAKERKGNVAVL
jgi:hypothetical protein